MRSQLNNKAYQWFTKHKVKAFYSLVDDVSFQAGANALIQVQFIYYYTAMPIS